MKSTKMTPKKRGAAGVWNTDGKTLRSRIRDKYKSQREFAKAVGVRESVLSGLIHGRRPLTPYFVKKFQTALR